VVNSVGDDDGGDSLVIENELLRYNGESNVPRPVADNAEHINGGSAGANSSKEGEKIRAGVEENPVS